MPRGGNDVIRGKARFCAATIRRRSRHPLRSARAAPCCHNAFDFAQACRRAVFARTPDPHPLISVRRQLHNPARERRRWLNPSGHAPPSTEQHRAIPYRPRKRSRMVQRRCIPPRPKRATAIGRLHSDQPAKRRRLPIDQPPVSVPVAPIASRAATAAAEPPDEPPGTSTAVAS